VKNLTLTLNNLNVDVKTRFFVRYEVLNPQVSQDPDMRIPSSISNTALLLCLVIVGGCAANPAAKPPAPEDIIDTDAARLSVVAPVAPVAVNNRPAQAKQTDSKLQPVSTKAVAAHEWSDVGDASPLILRVQSRGGTHLSAGDQIKIVVETDRDSQIHCYYRDGDGMVTRLFPNRFNTDSLLRSGETLVLPASDEWQLSATIAGASEDFMCIAIPPEWFDQLSVIPLLPDLQPKPAADLSQIFNRYKKALGTQLIKQSRSIAVH